MNVLKATEAQKNAIEALNGQFKDALIMFQQDADGHWIVGKNVLNNGTYAAAHSLLAELEEIPYKPAPPPE